MRVRRSTAAALLSLTMVLGGTMVWADIPVPPRDLPPGKQAHSLRVTLDENRDISFLRIPRAFLQPDKGPRAGLSALEQLDPMRSVIAALAMSCGVIGMLVLHKRRWSGAATMTVAAIVLTGVAYESWANAPAPPLQRTLTTPLHGDVVIEVVEQGFQVELVIGTKAKPSRSTPPGPPLNPPLPPQAPNANGAPNK